MATYTIGITATFSDNVVVEANSPKEARELAVQEFDNFWVIMPSEEGMDTVFEWDDIEAVSDREGVHYD